MEVYIANVDDRVSKCRLKDIMYRVGIGAFIIIYFNHYRVMKNKLLRRFIALSGSVVLGIAIQCLLITSSMGTDLEVVQSTLQDKEVTGRVTTSEDNSGLPGVNVIVKGTSKGTITDLEGNYKLLVPEGATLEFSSVGYMSESVDVGNKSVIDLTMMPDITQLQEVIVIGFGERMKKDLTGSISTVDAKTIERTNAISPQFALQGNAPGVRVVNASGNPNEAPEIYVRGIGTWNGDSQPLYVIDGQVIEPPRDGNEDVIGGGGLSTPPNLFNLLNPNDIETISVLKDAAASAVYGSRAANGVVLITTKRGKSGAPVVEFNTRADFQSIPTYSMLNTQQFVDIAQEMYANNSNPDVTIEQDLYGRDEATDLSRLLAFSPQFDPESQFFISDRTFYDWQGDMIRNNAITHSHDLRVSGATDRVDYLVSAGLWDQDGMIYGNDLRRYTGAVNINVEVTDWLKVGTNYKYTNQTSELNVADLPDIADAPPWQPIYDPDHETGFATVIDPFSFSDTWEAARIYGQGTNNNHRAITDLNFRSFDIARQLGQFYAELTPIKGLTLRGSLNMDYTVQQRIGLQDYSTNIFRASGIDPAEESPSQDPTAQGEFNKRINKIFNFQSDFTATYDRTFAGKHRVTITGAVQDIRHTREVENFSGGNLANIPDNPRRAGFGNDLANNSSFYFWDQKYWFGYVGRGSYVYDGKYYFDASYRRDGSLGFKPNSEFQWGNFYAFSGAWRISSEKFFQNVSSVNDLKIKAGWGQAGNDQAAVGSYAFLSGVSGGISSYSFGSGSGASRGSWQFGSVIADFPNESLTWEVVSTINVGFDALMFNNKLNVSFEWYTRETDGILQSVNLPITVGTNSPLFNIGKLRNNGVDVMVGWNDKIGDFRFGISGNMSFVNNEVTELFMDQPLSTGFGRVEEGREVGHIWGYKVGGIYQSQEEIDQYYEGITDQVVANTDFIEPGDMYFQNVGGNPTEDEPFYSTTPDTLMNSFDQTEIGNTIPGFIYGINLNAEWKGFDLSLSFYGEGDVDKVNSARQRFEGMAGAGSNFWASTMNRWTPNNRDTGMPRAVADDPAENNRFSDRWVESAAFFRLNNWQLGYSLPDAVLSKLKNTVSSVRIFVGGQNNIYLFSWSGVDPINDEFPLPKSFSVGLNARF